MYNFYYYDDNGYHKDTAWKFLMAFGVMVVLAGPSHLAGTSDFSPDNCIYHFCSWRIDCRKCVAAPQIIASGTENKNQMV